MKEKIKRFSKGIFEYELPFLCLPEDEINITIEAGKIFDGSFMISNSIQRNMKSIIYSSNRLLTFDQAKFEAVESTVSYHFNSVTLKPGDTVSGVISIVSDCGERILPFHVRVEAPFCGSSIGKIKDLFQFTNLARVNWSEAKKVFRSEEFERVLLGNEESYKIIYRNLLKSISTSQALEEFLIDIHKKSKIKLNIDKTFAEYEVIDESFVDKLTLTKDFWGYAEIKVSTDAPFIRLEQKFLWADRFIGNTNQITYMIDPKTLRIGKNFGRIWIKTLYQDITFDIVCNYHGEKERKTRQEKQFSVCLMDNYLNFRLDRININKYIEETSTLLNRQGELQEGFLKPLIETHLAIISGKAEEAEKLLVQLYEKEAEVKNESILYYCSYLYLNALYQKEEQIIKATVKTIRWYYENGFHNWEILWFLLYLDKGYEKNKANKLTAIREQFKAGCQSPILYYEAVCIFNEEPFLLRELEDFEIQTIFYGIKNWILAKDTAFQYTYLANKKKTFHPIIFRGLVKLYDEFGTEQILTAICCMLIKGYKKTTKYFEWYRLGAEAQLKITELYEYYMYSISETSEEILALPIYHYFIYNSNLTDKKRAFLYANIIKNKDIIEAIYHSYYKKMEVFAEKMLAAHVISHDLAVLYQEFIDKKTPNDEVAKQLPFVLYRQELICENPNVYGVIVVHEELNMEESYPLLDGRTQVDIFSDRAKIILAENNGYRFTDSFDYRLQPYLNPEEYENSCLNFSNHPMLILHLYDRYHKHQVMNEASITIRKQVLEIPELRPEYRMECLLDLSEYYFENYQEELLEHYLDLIDIDQVKPINRMRVIELYLLRSFNTKALAALQEFGFEEIVINRLLRLCSGWLHDNGFEINNEFILSLCYFIFTNGKYNEEILSYLVKYYNGPTIQMFQLWKAAKGFDLYTHQLEENLLGQMLFAESYVEDSFLVFDEYYKNVTKPMLVKAFLSYYAYKYLVHDRVIDTALFSIMRRELYYEENDIYLLAWLKFQTTNKIPTENEINYIEFNIHNLVKKKIILPFFKEFKKVIKLPESIADKTYVEYTTDPKKQVFLHYSLLKDATGDDYITERLPNTFMGIHCKEFILFYHEIMQYYITEEYKEDVNVTESFQICCEKDATEEESKYNQINLILMAEEMQEESTLTDMMEHFIKMDFTISQCFEPI